MHETDLILADPPVAPAPAIQMAQLNITYAGQQGNLPDLLPFDLDDTEIKRIAREALTQGIPGINPVAGVDLKDFMIDRFPSRPDMPANRLSLRPKTPFGA